MEVTKEEFTVFYALIKKFINAVDTKDSDILKYKFNIIEDNVDYLYETLYNYYDQKTKIDILPFEEAYNDAVEEQRYCDIFKFNDEECWGVDFNILANGKIDEPKFHFKICKKNEQYILEFLYIDS